jgi:hypothetical protein
MKEIKDWRNFHWSVVFKYANIWFIFKSEYVYILFKIVWIDLSKSIIVFLRVFGLTPIDTRLTAISDI